MTAHLRRGLALGIVSLVLTVGAGACGDDDDGDDTELPNPAAAFCEEQGGVVTGEEPMCELPDGSVVDAWEYYRETNPVEESS